MQHTLVEIPCGLEEKLLDSGPPWCPAVSSSWTGLVYNTKCVQAHWIGGKECLTHPIWVSWDRAGLRNGQVYGYVLIVSNGSGFSEPSTVRFVKFES